MCYFYLFCNSLATTEIYTYLHSLSLPYSLPISAVHKCVQGTRQQRLPARKRPLTQACMARLYVCTSSTRSATASGGVYCEMPCPRLNTWPPWPTRSEEHTSDLQAIMRSSYAVFCMQKKKT